VYSHAAALPRLSNMAIASDEAEYQVGTAEETRREAFIGISSYRLKLALERRGNPVEDLLGAMGNAEVCGRKWNEGEIALNGVLTALGGIDTTRSTTAGAMLEFICHPEELARLRANRALMLLARAPRRLPILEEKTRCAPSSPRVKPGRETVGPTVYGETRQVVS
jgi:cytochrome P450